MHTASAFSLPSKSDGNPWALLTIVEVLQVKQPGALINDRIVLAPSVVELCTRHT